MPTADGCRARRQRLLERLGGPLLLGDPLNLRYFAGCYVDPFSLGADFGGLLHIREDGHATLYHDNRLPKSVELSCVDERVVLHWYDGKSPGHGPRRLRLQPIIAQCGGRVHDALTDPQSAELLHVVSELRRVKDPDEIETLNRCMRATEAGHAWARTNVKPGMTELQVYNGVFAACTEAVGEVVIVYGDFLVSPGAGKRVGMPTRRVLQAGETFIVDFSVIIAGYRSDFTTTLVVGGKPTAEQQRMFELCVEAMAAGEKLLKAGNRCLDVYRAVRGVFDAAGVGEKFPHHAGHGLGISHPEAPFFVENATETLIAGDVVTLEPGMYEDGIGGMRFEHNYRITTEGFERLSRHAITLY